MGKSALPAGTGAAAGPAPWTSSKTLIGRSVAYGRGEPGKRELVRETWFPSRERAAGEGGSFVVGEEGPHELVERLTVAARHGHRGERAHGGCARHLHRQRDLTEVIARPQHALSSAGSLAHGEHPAQYDVEALAGLAFLDDACPCRDLLAGHLLREPCERLARKGREQADPRQLVLSCAGRSRAHSSGSSVGGSGASPAPTPRAASSSSSRSAASSCSSSVGVG